MATDYDARRADPDGDAIIDEHQLTVSGPEPVDDDRSPAMDTPDADLSGLTADDLDIEVLARSADELACSRCFLLFPRSRRAPHRLGRVVCRDCV